MATGLATGGQSFNGDEGSDINLITWVFTVINIVAVAFVLGHKMYSQRRKWPRIDELLLLFTLVGPSRGGRRVATKLTSAAP